MAKDYPRSYRVADQIQQALAVILRDELKDPRLSSMLTISEVDVSKDLSVARIYYTLLDNSDRGATEAALQSGTGFLRRRLGQRIKLRAVPQLHFYYDESIERGAYMSALINEAVASNTTSANADPDAELEDATEESVSSTSSVNLRDQGVSD